jgi:TPP-dependent pyruvate/acetoin dehydrogenase alpha subunit
VNISAVWKLPIVFVCENNQYAANNAVAVQHRNVDLAVHAASYGMPGVTVDGNDVHAVYAAAGAAIARARHGEGPTLLECKTYRWHFHAMRAVRPPETRPADEIAAWKARDPIARLSAELTAQRVLSELEVGALQRQVQADLQAAVAFAEASPFPDAKDILVDMFAAQS